MRTTELSRRSGTPVATVKFYRRAGLLPAGAGRAGDDQRQLYRLRAIRVLRETCHLPVAVIAAALRAAGPPPREPRPTRPLPTEPRPAGPPPAGSRRERMRRLQRALLPAASGSDHPAQERVAGALRALAAAGHPDPARALAGYRAAGLATAERDAAREAARSGRAWPDPAAAALLGLVLGDALLATLHRLAHEHLARTTPAPGR